MFKVSGATVYPIEVETGLLAMPGVTLAFVTDLEYETGVEVGAVLVGDELDPAQVAARARTVLSSFKLPTVWLTLRHESEVPRLASDKPDKNALRRLLRERGIRVRR
jgi:acyl-CoA synthetase (AMP-forming)/AMP-acid ligase II